MSRAPPDPGPPVRQYGRRRGDVVFGVVFFERGGNQRRRLLFRQWEMKAFLPEETVSAKLALQLFRHSPGSSDASGTGDSGVWPPMAIIRSIARRAREATSGGTVIRCCMRCKEVRTLGSVVTFMKAQTALSFAAKKVLLGFSRRRRCSMPTSVATMNSSLLEILGRLIIPSV